MCRKCEATKDTVKALVTDSHCVERDDETHKERCSQLLELTPGGRKYWSKQWGINEASCLLQLEGFSLINSLVQDPMHVLLEGVVKREMEILLDHLISVIRYFTLNWLNDRVQSFPLSYMHKKNRPERIDTKTHGNIHMKLTAAAVLMLCQMLPIIVGCRVRQGDLHWANFLRLAQIVNLSISPYCARE